ncbi:hypothetical protein BDY19DRAFT_133221 [Irpex rosettiformis]|uniref:Uncharacterized protein n=1 Tax=Irpex rosettiformis TaxID=378272 RepID=A0ACB8U563_9APHY|nr:hypothetical protein BDY19DRAFT_133221 [Irpex rosettiformis]
MPSSRDDPLPQAVDGTNFSRRQMYAFFSLQIIGGHVGVPIILATFLISGVRRHPLVVNFLGTWIIYATSFCLLLYTGYQFKHDIPRTLCIIQASLIHGVSLMAPIATFAFVLNLWLSTRATCLVPDEEDGLTPPKRPMTSCNRVLLVAPYTVFLICVFVILAVPDPKGDIIFRVEGSLYCTIQSSYTRIVPLIASSIMIIVLILEGIIIARLRKLNRIYGQLGSQQDYAPPIIVRIMLFSVCLFIALIALCISIVTEVDLVSLHIIQSILPTAVFVIFGTQKDLLEAWGLVGLWVKFKLITRGRRVLCASARELAC